MDPITKATRRESYEGILPKQGTRCRLILDTLGTREMTASEITEALLVSGEITYFNRNFVAPRLTELKEIGIIHTIGRRRCTRSGSTEAVRARTGATT